MITKMGLFWTAIIMVVLAGLSLWLLPRPWKWIIPVIEFVIVLAFVLFVAFINYVSNP